MGAIDTWAVEYNILFSPSNFHATGIDPATYRGRPSLPFPVVFTDDSHFADDYCATNFTDYSFTDDRPGTQWTMTTSHRSLVRTPWTSTLEFSKTIPAPLLTRLLISQHVIMRPTMTAVWRNNLRRTMFVCPVISVASSAVFRKTRKALRVISKSPP